MPGKKNQLFFMLLLAGLWIAGQSVMAEEEPLPVLYNVGTLPVQWNVPDDDQLRYADFSRHLDQAFPLVIAESNRFRIIHHSLVKKLWSSPSGRQELEQRFELDAYVGLNGIQKPDHMLLEARLLDPKLQVLMIEQDTLPLTKARNLSFDEARDTVHKLVFRLLNRLPIDIVVTSIQDRYITLSGGINQGIHNGDNLEMLRAVVSSRHPAYGGWYLFKTYKVGQVRVIDSGPDTAVALVLSQPYQNSLKIGDGARVGGIMGRSYYARATTPKTKPSWPGGILVPPAGELAEVKSPQKQTKKPVKGTGSEIAALAQAGETSEESDSTTLAAPESGLTDSSTMDSADSEEDAWQGVLEGVADELIVSLGQGHWNYTGPGSTGSKFVWYYPINNLSVRFTRSIMNNLKYGVGGSVGFGKTKGGGSFFSYDGNVRAFWEDDLAFPDLGLTTWQAGVDGRFSGLGVESEPYGGGDVVMGGLFGSLLGTMQVNQTLYDWAAVYSITPLTIGRVGYDGNRRVVRSSLGWKLSLEAIEKQAPEPQMGLGLEYGNHTVLDNTGNETSRSLFNLNFLLRWQI